MPTPKQVRFHYAKISRLRFKLQMALDAAHYAKVLTYENYQEESPCKLLYDCWDRIKKTTEAQLAEAMREEIAKKWEG